MRKFLAAAAMLLLACAGGAHAAAHNLQIQQRNSTDTGPVIRNLATPPSNAVVFYDVATNLPGYLTFGSGITLSGTVITAPHTQADWNAVSGDAQILNRPSLAIIATTGSINDLVDSTSTGRAVLGAANAAAARTAIGAGTSSFDGAYASLSGTPSTFAPSSHTHAAADITSGTLADARIPSLAISKTTGLQAALDAKFTTPSGTTLQYVRGDGTLATLPAPGTGTVTSVAAGTGLSGGTITTSGTISMPNTGTAGTYSGVTTDAQGRVTAGTTRTYNNNVARTLNSSYTVSSTRDSRLSYSINASWTVQALLSGSGTAFLEYSTDGGTNWITVNQVGKQLQLLTFQGTDDMNLTGDVPANVLTRIRTTSSNMTIAYVRGQEVLQ